MAASASQTDHMDRPCLGPSLGWRSLIWASVVAGGFLAVFCAWVDWSTFVDVLLEMRVDWLLASFACLVSANLVRTWRFAVLASQRLAYSSWWSVSQIHNFLTAALPGGAGEAATAFIVRRYIGMTLLDGVRILVASRILDLGGISLAFLVAALALSGTATYREPAITISVLFLAGSIVALLPGSEQRFFALVVRLGSSLGRWSAMLVRKTEALQASVTTVRRSDSLLRSCLLSIVFVFFSVSSVHFAFKSLSVEMTPVQTVYCFGVYALFQLLPIHGLGGVGTQPAWWVLGMAAAGHQSDGAGAYGLALHATYFVMIAVLGSTGFVLAVLRSNLRAERGRPPELCGLGCDDNGIGA